MNVMKLIYSIFYLSLFMMCATSCGKEDSLVPNETQKNYFIISPDATDPVSVLRREFRERNEVHLLFNDTLCHEQQGTNTEGIPIWYTEILDLSYSLTSGGDELYLDYLTGQSEMKEGIHFIETYMIPRLASPLRPYSILLVNQLSENYYGTIRAIDYYLGYRCLALSVGNIAEMNEQEKRDFFSPIFGEIISKKINNVPAAVMEKFYTFSKEFYGKTYAAAGVPEDENYVYDYDKVYSRGLLRAYYNLFISADYDLSDYIEALFNTSEEEFKNKYAAYPIIGEKYDVLKQIISDLGFIF